MPTTHNNHTRAEITALAETLIAKLSEAINSMTPGELLLLLYDELVKRSTLASMALEKQDYDQELKLQKLKF